MSAQQSYQGENTRVTRLSVQERREKYKRLTSQRHTERVMIIIAEALLEHRLSHKAQTLLHTFDTIKISAKFAWKEKSTLSTNANGT